MQHKSTKKTLNARDCLIEPIRTTATSSLYLVRNQERHVLGFIEKFQDDEFTTNPWKVFHAIVGQGPVRVGEMIAAVYTGQFDAIRLLMKEHRI